MSDGTPAVDPGRYRSVACGYTRRECQQVGRTPGAPAAPSPRALSLQFACPKAAIDGDEPPLLERVRSAIPGLDAALTPAAELARMARKTVAKPLAE